MATHTSLVRSKSILTCSKIAILTCLLFFIIHYINFGTLRALNLRQSSKDTTRLAAAENHSLHVMSKFVYLEGLDTRCNPANLNELSVNSYGRRKYVVRLVQTSTGAFCPRELKEVNSVYPRTWLISPPGSGNTWLRHLLQQLTGYYTGSIYHDNSLRTSGFPYENHIKNVVAIKAHSFNAIERHKNIKIDARTDRIILLIRNPYPALLAEYKRGQMRLKHTGNAEVRADKSWFDYLSERVPKWQAHIHQEVKWKNKKLIVFYEDLTSELLRQLMRLANFIRTKDVNKFAFCCALQEREGNNHREKSNQTLEDVYTKENRLYMNAMLTDLSKSIEEDDPNTAKRFLSYIMSI